MHPAAYLPPLRVVKYAVMQGVRRPRMESWRSKAYELFAPYRERLERAESSYQLWHELLFLFEDAYASNDQELIASIYSFAFWCGAQPSGNSAEDDLPTCVSVCFFEHIPEIAGALEDMPRWWPLETVQRMKQLFTYHVGEEGYARILARYA